MSANTRDTLEQATRPDRVHYATGVMLGAEDFQAEQDYHRGRLARALAYTLGYGTVAGLAVSHHMAVAETASVRGRPEQIRVESGLALDRIGRLIEVPRALCLDLAQWYTAQSASRLRQSWHAADALWSGSPSGIGVDVFIRFMPCRRDKTPSFASSAFDSFDSITAARIRDGFEVSLILREEAAPPLPVSPWPDFAGDTQRLRDAIVAAWQAGSADATADGLDPLAEHVAGQDTRALFLARIVLPADFVTGDPAPIRRTAEPVVVRNELRPFVIPAGALARWLGVSATAGV